MAFDFPSSPGVGQKHPATPVAGVPTYTWDGQKWTTASTYPGGLDILTRRNRVVNGAMQISQERGDTAATWSGFYPADQWVFWCNTNAGVFTAQRLSNVLTPGGSKHCIQITITTADTTPDASDHITIDQFIEGQRVADFCFGTGSAKQIVLRFGWRSPAGTYCVAIRDGNYSRSYIANFTITAGQANTDTVQTIVIPGDQEGTWSTDNSIGVTLSFSIAAASTFHIPMVNVWTAGTYLGSATMSNGMATAGAVFRLFDVGLYLDVDKTGVPPRWELPDPVQELATCQRYFQSLLQDTNGIYTLSAEPASNDLIDYVYRFSTMRTPPTLLTSGQGAHYGVATTGGGSLQNCTAVPGRVGVSTQSMMIRFTKTGHGITGAARQTRTAPEGFLHFNARM